MSVQIGISTGSFYPKDITEALMEIGKCGGKNAEVFLNTFSDLDNSYLLELKEIIDFYDIKVLSVHPFTSGFEPMMLFTEYERRFNDGLELYKRFFDAMNTLGAKYLTFHGDRKGSKMCEHDYFERFAKLRDLGKAQGVVLAQENVERCKSGSVEFLKNMISCLDNDVGIVFDNKQALRSGIDYHEFITAFSQNIVNVHLSDHNADDDCIAIGRGELDALEILTCLRDTGYNKGVLVELYSERLESIDDIIDSYNFLLATYTRIM